MPAYNVVFTLSYRITADDPEIAADDAWTRLETDLFTATLDQMVKDFAMIDPEEIHD